MISIHECNHEDHLARCQQKVSLARHKSHKLLQCFHIKYICGNQGLRLRNAGRICLGMAELSFDNLLNELVPYCSH